MTANGDALSAWNPLYTGSAINYSDAFTVLAVGVALALTLVAPLPTKKMVDIEKAKEAEQENWTDDCAVPWSPELEGDCLAMRVRT